MPGVKHLSKCPGNASPQPSPLPSVSELSGARQRLFAALTGEQPLQRRDLEQLAAAACWPLPESVRAVVSRDIRTAIHVPGGCRVLRQACVGRVRVLVAGSGSTSDRNVTTALGIVSRSSPAVVGPHVPLALAGTSLRWAEFVLTELGRDARGVHRAADHPVGWLLARNREMGASLAEALLEPLDQCSPQRREQLEATLLAWIQWRAAPEAARALRVHPQTVRYRMRQLSALFGQALSDPDMCLALELALRSRHPALPLR